MGLYSTMTDQELLAEIKQYRDALKAVAIGGGVGVVAGEGRRVEYVQGNSGEARLALRELLVEAQNRRLIERTGGAIAVRSEEHTSELQSLMRISYAVFCLKKKKD